MYDLSITVYYGHQTYHNKRNAMCLLQNSSVNHSPMHSQFGDYSLKWKIIIQWLFNNRKVSKHFIQYSLFITQFMGSIGMDCVINHHHHHHHHHHHRHHPSNDNSCCLGCKATKQTNKTNLTSRL